MPRRAKAPSPRLVDNLYRVSLTKEVRRTLGIGPGDYVTFQVTDDGAVLLHKITLSIAPLPAPFSPRPPLPAAAPALGEAGSRVV